MGCGRILRSQELTSDEFRIHKMKIVSLVHSNLSHQLWLMGNFSKRFLYFFSHQHPFNECVKICFLKSNWQIHVWSKKNILIISQGGEIVIIQTSMVEKNQKLHQWIYWPSVEEEDKETRKLTLFSFFLFLVYRLMTYKMKYGHIDCKRKKIKG